MSDTLYQNQNQAHRSKEGYSTALAPNGGAQAPIRKIDITLAARSTRHLYMISVIGGVFLFFIPSIIIPVILIGNVSDIAEGVISGLVFLAFLAGIVWPVLHARRQLNGWAYLTAAICAGWMLVFSLGAAVSFVLSNGLVEAGFFALVAVYPARVLIDFVRLWRARYEALGIGPLRLANDVATLFRYTRGKVSWLHKPTHPIKTGVHVVLFFASVPAAYLINAFIPLLGWALPITQAAMIRRHYRLPAHRLLELDERRPILFLRAFGEDKVRLFGKGLIGKFRRRTIDEAIAPLAQRLGPFVAIADPNKRLPALGAAKSFYSNDTWQDAIAEWSAMARLIVMVAGRTEGVRWELDHIFEHSKHAKLVVFFPPSLQKDTRALTRWLQEHFSDRLGAELMAIDLWKTLAITFDHEGLFVVESAKVSNSEVDYIVAFQAIIFAKAAAAS